MQCKNSTERTRRFKQNNPFKYWWQTIKDNAKRRGRYFDLTIDEFIEFCGETNYDKLKGKTALSLSMDCRDPFKGYTKENIRAITLRDNSKLANATLLDPEWQPLEFCPF